jgi:CelD/BcsL family acetyltransferase involved in cellulose biosynthesis
MAPLRASRVTDSAGFAGLAPVWADLVSRAGRPSPFLSHEWFSCCWDAVQPDRRPEVVVVSEGQDPVALVPLMGWTQRLRGLPVRCLGLLEAPDSPEIDLLTVAEPRAVVAALLDHLASRSDWDLVHLQKLAATSPTLKALEELAPGRFGLERLAPLVSPYLTVAGDWETFFRGRTQRFRKTVRSVQNRLERVGVVTVEEHTEVDPASPLFREVVELSRRSWKADRGVAISTMPRMLEFFGALTRCASERGWLSLWVLRLDGRAVAMEYQLQSGGVVHALRADFDAEFAALSPGSQLNHLIARALFERGGVHEYDMGPGENEYKLRWSTGTHQRVRLRLYGGRLYSRLLRALEARVLPALRALRGRAE